MVTNAEDLGVKLGTKDEVFWSDMKKATEDQNLQANRTLELNETILKHCEQRISEEQKV